MCVGSWKCAAGVVAVQVDEVFCRRGGLACFLVQAAVVSVTLGHLVGFGVV